MSLMLRKRLAMLALAALALPGCAGWQIPESDADAVDKMAKPNLPLPAKWMAPIAHGGELGALQQWWSRTKDPVLLSLIQRAQKENAQMDVAAARIAAARAQLRLSGSASSPAVDVRAGLSRSTGAGVPLNTTAIGAVDANWEIDLFGGARAGRLAAQQGVMARQADWHALRVSLAAEVALLYANLRVCERQVQIFSAQVDSTSKTLELTDQRIRAGFQAPADASLLRAARAQAQDRLAMAVGECDVLIKSLVTVSASDETQLRAQLQTGTASLPLWPGFALTSVPADLLLQRADLSSAAHDMAAAYAQVGTARANQYPRLSLLGSVGAFSLRSGGQTLDGPSWSIGPSLYLPLFNGNRTAGQIDAALARQAEMVAQFKVKVGLAVLDTEEALVRLQTANARAPLAVQSAESFEAFQRAVQDRYRVGLGNLFELEDARRTTLAAGLNMLAVERERATAWINLYKAVGGGFEEGQHASAE
jgi:outer membrane protein, multidrug efflux system